MDGPLQFSSGPRFARLTENLRRREIPCLYGIRGIAALSVVFYHGIAEWFPGPGAVTTFFVLSGFLITWLLLKEKESQGKISLRNFWVRRSLRIFPAFYIFWIIQMLTFGADRGAAASSFLYFFNYWFATGHSANSGPFGHTWSLDVEEQFYLLWPALFVRIVRPFSLAPKLLLLAAAIQIIRFVLTPLTSWRYVYEAFEMRCDALLIGCATAMFLHGGGVIREWLLHPALSIAAGAVIMLVSVDGRAVTSAHYGAAVVAWASMLLILQAITHRPRWLDNPFMKFLGLISYSVYLYHVLVISAIELVKLPKYRYVVVANVVGPVLAATASYLLIERPVLKLKARFSSGARGLQGKLHTTAAIPDVSSPSTP